jgi:glutamine---fructose-6-phosphate transaminase (isomerizing)
MCGIVGLISQTDVSGRLVEGLKRLEYRGYDSAGIATIQNQQIHFRRAKGKLRQLQEVVSKSPIQGFIGIGHTRWATHGVPSEENAHPHVSERVAVVHNGIIENFAELKKRLLELGHQFNSQTDTEVVVHLVTHYLNEGAAPLLAVRQALNELKGAFAIAIIFKDYDQMMMVARRGSPLVIGYGNQEMAIGSDALVLAPWTRSLCYLEEGDYAMLTASGVEIYNESHQKVERPIRQSLLTNDSISKGGYRHYMLKEIFEQPVVIGETLQQFLADGQIQIPQLAQDWSQIERLQIIACGTSYYAGMVAKYWFEKYARLSVDVDIASEFRYRETPLHAKGVTLLISQSGETIDTLTALNLVKAQGQKVIALVNVPESSMARQADYVLYTQAGPEIGVASTKAFTTQLVVLACLVLEAAQHRRTLTEQKLVELTQALQELSSAIVKVLQQDTALQRLADRLRSARDTLFLGRGTSYPIALEGALKLKELSYIHAEAYPAGELKHGPIALIDENMPVLVIAPNDPWMVKTLSNVQEVVARGGEVICFTDGQGRALIEHEHIACEIFEFAAIHSFTAPVLYTVAVQLLAYFAAFARGTDVDQPRNLAKSVTVE